MKLLKLKAMKKIFATIAAYVSKLVKIQWIETLKNAKQNVKTTFKTAAGALFEISAIVKNGEVIKGSVSIQGLLFA